MTGERCEAVVVDRRCFADAKYEAHDNSYVVAGVNRGDRVALCGTHYRAARQGRGVWVAGGPRGQRFYEHGQLR